MRGFPSFQRDMTSFVYDQAGNQLWPDALLIQGVDRGLVLRGELHNYVTSEAELSKYKNVTRIQAAGVAPPKTAPNSNVMTNAVLSASGAAQFVAAGKACKVVYLK